MKYLGNIDGPLTLPTGSIYLGDGTSNVQQSLYITAKNTADSLPYQARFYVSNLAVSGGSRIASVLYENGAETARTELNAGGDFQVNPGTGLHAVPQLWASTTANNEATKKIWMGYSSVTTTSAGLGTVTHGAGFTPTGVIVQHRSGSTGSPVLVCRQVSGSYAATTFQFTAMVANTAAAYAGTVGVEYFMWA